jgi:hypothetical protein
MIIILCLYVVGAVACVLEVQTGAMGLIFRVYFAVNRRTYLRNISRSF